jgi:hypothetical protein
VKLLEATETLGKQDSLIKTFKIKEDKYKVEFQKVAENWNKMTKIKTLHRTVNEEFYSAVL